MTEQNDHYEIERRWLITKIRGGVRTLQQLASMVVEIEQGYFEITDPKNSFRVRVNNGLDAELTIKSGEGIIREETPPDERFVHINMGKKMLEISHHKLTKTRHII